MVVTSLQNISAAAFVLLGVATGIGWVRKRNPSMGFLALAIILLSLVSVVARLSALLHLNSMAVADITVVAFIGSAYALQPQDFITPIIRDLGAVFVKGIRPREIFAQVDGTLLLFFAALFVVTHGVAQAGIAERVHQ